jgi:hypothetical protein
LARLEPEGDFEGRRLDFTAKEKQYRPRLKLELQATERKRCPVIPRGGKSEDDS